MESCEHECLAAMQASLGHGNFRKSDERFTGCLLICRMGRLVKFQVGEDKGERRRN